MTLKLVERALVKDIANIARADLFYDNVLNAMIALASDQAQRYCRRTFAYGEKTQFFTSYDHSYTEPDPQYLWLEAWPLDDAQPIEIKWALYDDHDVNGITLNRDDFFWDDQKRVIMVRRATGITQTLLIGTSFRRPIFAYAPRGFRVKYTGGYKPTTKPEGEAADPLDDYGVLQVPDGLKSIVAAKVANDFKQAKRLMPWSKSELAELQPYTKKDLIG